MATIAVLLVGLFALGCGEEAPDDSDSGSGGVGVDSSSPELMPKVGEPIEVDGTATAVTVGEGSVWVADNTAGTVIQVDPDSRRKVGEPISVGSGPAALATGEGGVWVASGDDTVYRIDAEAGTAERIAVDAGDPRGIAVGEGSVWVSSSTANTLTRIDPSSLEIVGEPIPVGGRPGDVAVGDGRVWVVGNEDGTVTEIDAASAEVVRTIETSEFGAFAIALADDGLWVAKAADRLATEIELVRIDPDSGEVGEQAIPLPGAAIPVRLAAGEGALWATVLGGIRPPSTIDEPARVAYLPTGATEFGESPLRVPDQPAGIAIGEGAVWVTGADDGVVTAITP